MHTIAQWTNLSMLYYGEWQNQEANSGVVAEKVTFSWVHRPVWARLCYYRRRMGLGDSVLAIGHWTRSLSGIGTWSHGLMTFWTNLRGENISARSTWSQNITRYQLNPPMCGRLPSKPRRAFLNGWLCILGWWMLLQPSWGWWMTSCSHSPTHL